MRSQVLTTTGLLILVSNWHIKFTYYNTLQNWYVYIIIIIIIIIIINLGLGWRKIKMAAWRP